MESEKLKKNSVRLDWRNWCELKVLHIYVLIWMLVLRLCSGGQKEVRILRGRGRDFAERSLETLQLLVPSIE